MSEPHHHHQSLSLPADPFLRSSLMMSPSHNAGAGESPGICLSDDEGDSDEQRERVDILADFDEALAKRRLLHSHQVDRVVLTIDQQRSMGIEVGVNITAEHPWQQIARSTLLDHLPDDLANGAAFRQKLRAGYGPAGDPLVLIGYVADESEMQDVFVVYDSTASALRASLYIEQLEANERRLTRLAQFKRPRARRPALDDPAAAAPDRHRFEPRTRRVDVEVQSVYPLKHSQRRFDVRRTADVCDGYAQLVPVAGVEFANVGRRRVEAVVQSTAARVSFEQQTEPLFPSNAWTQYLYELNPELPIEINEDYEEEPTAEQVVYKKRKEPNMPIIPSDRVDDLLENLTFNDVNMYKNDYPFINDTVVEKFKVPYLVESICFIDMAKSVGRVVSSMDWHPVFSGLVAVSYSFSNLSTTESLKKKDDIFQSSVHMPHHCTMWSFNEQLYPKFEMDAPREVSRLSYCPYDENLLLGGTQSGQLLVWDLKNRLRQVETDEVLTAVQRRSRDAMADFLGWTKQTASGQRHPTVYAVAQSALQHSHKAAVTSVQWLSRESYVTPNGRVKRQPNGQYRYVVTSSLDGTVAFWNMDFVDDTPKSANAAQKPKCPAHMVPEPSVYESINGVFRPQFMLQYHLPITGLVIDAGCVFRYTPLAFHALTHEQSLTTRIKHRIKCIEADTYDERIVVSTMIGTLALFVCEGSDQRTDLVKREKISNAKPMANMHDGIVVAIARNPFVSELILSVGRNVLCLWSVDLLWSPIFWRRSTANLTDVCWSKDRPSVFFVTRGDGTFEAWDILVKSETPCLDENLGSSQLTGISQHKLTMLADVLAIGNFNSSLRMFQIPTVFKQPLPDEQQQLEDFVRREVARKNTLDQWQKAFYKANSDIREARERCNREAALEFERAEKAAREAEDIARKLDEMRERKERANDRSRSLFDLPERLEAKWDAMNIRRLTRVLMEKKKVKPSELAEYMKPELKRREYERKKRAAVAESFRTAIDDLALIRTQLMPSAVADTDRMEDIHQRLVDLMQSGAADQTTRYEEICAEAEHVVAARDQRTVLNFADVLLNGQRRREQLNRSLRGHDGCVFEKSLAQLEEEAADAAQQPDEAG